MLSLWQTLYQTRHIQISEINKNFTMQLPLIAKHMMILNLSTLETNSAIHQKWSSLLNGNQSEETNFTDGNNIIIVDIRLREALVDTWNEEVTSSLFSLMANIGGTLGLCAGISFLSALFLLIFFGNAFYHLFMLVILWFWWNIYQGRPKAAPVEEMRILDARSRSIEKKVDDDRPFRSSGHMRAVSTVIRSRERSVIYDPWIAAQMQYGRPKSSTGLESPREFSITNARNEPNLTSLHESADNYVSGQIINPCWNTIGTLFHLYLLTGQEHHDWY